ncbi:myocardin related transcription factor Ab isoform X2 [Stigmatopora argus]
MEVTGAGVWNQSPQSEAVTSELQELSLQVPPDELRLQDRKNVLQLKLQQRRTREELVSQGIMPPLKSPAAFHEQRRSLERARTEDYLKRKIRSRPERSELVRMHILEETSAEPSLQAKQLQLKRARLADDLNDKISHRPGPIELVHKNILSVCPDQDSPPDSPKGAGGESSSLDEDSSGDPLSPDQLTNHDSPLSAAPQPSPSDGLSLNGDVSPIQFVTQAAPQPPPTPVVNGSGSPPPPKVTNGIVLTSRTTCTPFGQLKSHSKTSSDRPPLRSKKAKDNKPKVKKLKYHQYIPPDQKADKERPPLMDSSYAKLLQQQQLFLQLQILNQQQQHYNYHAILPAPPKPATEQPLPTNPSPSPTRNIPTINGATPAGGNARQAPAAVGGAKPTALPANLDELKVAELKQELKLRGLTVSGTKNDLIERLRNYQEQNGGPAAAGSRNGAPQPVHPSEGGLKSPPAPALPARVVRFGSTGSSPPVSPSPSERSLAGLSPDETSCNGDTFGEMVSSPLTQLTLHPSPRHPSSVSPGRAKEDGFHGSSPGPANPSEPFSAVAVDKDQMLQEKDKQIEELTRMLRQKQRLVETLRSQLELGKTAPSDGAPKVSGDGLLKVKEEVGEEAMAGVVEEAQSKRALQPTQCSQETLLKLQQIKRLQVQQAEQPKPRAPEPVGPQPQPQPQPQPPKDAERKNEDAQILLRQQRQLQQLIIQQTRQKQLQAQQHRLSQQAAQGKRNPTSHKNPLQIKQLRVQVRNQVAADQGHQRKQPKTQKRQQQRQPSGGVAGVTLGAQQVAPVFINQQQNPAQIHTQAISLDLLKAGGTLVTDANGNHYLIALAANAADGTKRAPSQVKSANGRVTLQRLQSTPSEMPGADGQSQAGKMSQSVSQPIQKREKAELHLDTNGVLPPTAAPSCATAPANLQPFFDDMSSDSESQSNAGSSFKRAQACPSYDRHTLFTPPSPKPNTFLPTQRSKGNGVNYQQMDDLFDILLKSGEISGFKANPDPSLAPLHSEPPSPASPLHLSPPTPPSPLISAGVPPRDGRLDDFLESSALLGAEPAGGLGLMDGLHGQMLGGGAGGPLDHSPSPMDTSDLGFSPHSTGLDFGDGALDSMDWLDISMVGGTGEGEGSGVLTPLAPHTPPSVFSADFLDGTDLQLHLESCL